MGNSDSGCGWIIIVTGFIASLIAIFVFVTGLQGIRDILELENLQDILQTFTGRERVVRPTPFPTSEVVFATSTPRPVYTPTITLTPKPTSTPRPTSTPQVLESGNPTVSIRLYDEPDIRGEGVMKVRFLMANQPTTIVEKIKACEVIKDITGQWSFVEDKWSYDICYEVYLDPQQGGFTAKLSAGDYSFFIALHHRDIDVWGHWGNWIVYSFGCQENVAFPIFEGKRTEITVSLSSLEVAFMSGEDVLKGWSAWVHYQDKDISGKPIIVDECRYAWGQTDVRGLATFALAPGTYVVAAVSPGSPTFHYFYNVIVVPNESRRQIFRVE